MNMPYYKSKDGEVFYYSDASEKDRFGQDGLVLMTDIEVHEHLHPVMTDEQMKESEIQQDKQYLSDTDWIVAKIGEASLLGQDTSPLIEQYKTQLDTREIARIRIRQNEGRA